MPTFAKGDVVKVLTCPTHNPTIEGATVKPTTIEAKVPPRPVTACWCQGEVKRVFADGNLLITGRRRKVFLFPPEEVVLIRR